MERELREPRIGRRDKVWKQITLTPEQARVAEELITDRRWNFQILAEEALSFYFASLRIPWPPSKPRKAAYAERKAS